MSKIPDSRLNLPYPPNASLDEVFEVYRANVLINRRRYNKRLTAYNNHIKPLLGKKVALEITTTDYDKLASALTEAGLHPDKIFFVLSTFKVVIIRYYRELHLYNCPFKGYVSPLQPAPMPYDDERRYLSQEELKLFFDNLPSDDKSLVNILQMALLTGRKRADLCYLRWRDVDEKNGWISFRDVQNTSSIVLPRRPNDYRDLIPINPKIQTIFDEQIVLSGSSDYVFSNSGKPYNPNLLNRLKDRALASVNSCPEYSLRHFSYRAFGTTAIINFINQGIPISLVAMMTGHVAENIAKLYSVYSPPRDLESSPQ